MGKIEEFVIPIFKPGDAVLVADKYHGVILSVEMERPYHQINFKGQTVTMPTPGAQNIIKYEIGFKEKIVLSGEDDGHWESLRQTEHGNEYKSILICNDRMDMKPDEAYARFKHLEGLYGEV